MQIDNKLLTQVLLKGNYVGQADLDKLVPATKARSFSLANAVVEAGLLTNDLLGQAVAEFYQLPYFDLNTNTPSRDVVFKLPEEQAKKLRALVVRLDNQGKKAIVATDSPSNKDLSAQLATLLPGVEIKLHYSLPEDIDAILDYYQKPLETRFSGIFQTGEKVAPKIFNEVIRDAVNLRASDVHLEPSPKGVLIRFRIDGVLQDMGLVPHDYLEHLINHIKVQSHLRIDEHFAAQDGSIRYELDNSAVDIRTSIVPTLMGEKAVLRILGAYVDAFGLTDIGLSQTNQGFLSEAAGKPFGMILVTGPTGSGKTTTLYTLLRGLNQPDSNLTTIEDPVEYRLAGVNQIQVNTAAGLTFASGLRSIVRQDPDVILVGEIRDLETVEISVNAALTGHLLFSTFHANDAATAIPRLLDMGAEPFLLSSTLEVIVAQRLVRKICDNCRYSYKATAEELSAVPGADKMLAAKGLSLYRGKKCTVCHNTGYKGRTAVFELIKMTPELRDLILKRPSAKEIWELVRSQGAISMFEDGLDKVKQGVTTLEELARVAAAPDDLLAAKSKAKK